MNTEFGGYAFSVFGNKMVLYYFYSLVGFPINKIESISSVRSDIVYLL